ncbi:MAG: Pup--protein ligase [Actinomycetales bacterium]|jgi:proteasome accessory factor A|uniref:Pup--protein ligase n=1 Tax=Candidatus Phosphoribacter hodrii TaxID=2953743 RepID=A0A935CCL9_9MICO|nr:Pup--protein ligase [Candidatus Phosphoribacter hodrii]MBP8837942.1 Pup--protein ligase [Dermatophilaceae bacterium]OPZ56177.1 MAG: Pup--protein ligase [bacterium ADurb.BinA028]MBK7272479.1 Pup--protein ligase [Candidatus Phosphoribacter hodrii]MBL0003711.1 Pup--protein ligase [Candidatus Phosphoribacter hodrii]
MKRRIFGVETEFGVTCTHEGQRRLTPDEVSRYLFRRVVAWGRSSNVFLGNGSRLYLDVGSHPEYATAECDSIREVVVHDKAGERILEGLAEEAQQRLADEGIAGDIYVFKNNTDSAGNSYGCHENYLIGRTGEFSLVSDMLIPFLISRQIICGAGKLASGSKRATYCVSQRADHIWEGVSSATTRSRPIINTRDEPHADAEKFRRLHVIVGDSNMSETTTLLKVGSADLVLRMAETGVVMRDLALENPIRAIREMSHDMTGRRTVRLADGRSMSALDMQSEYFTRVRAFADREGLTDGAHARVLELWERTLHAVETNNLALVEREIDWVIKWRMIERYAAKHQLSLDDPRLAQLDLAYHDVNRRRGLFYLLQRRGLVTREASDLEVFRAKTVAPQTTRARLRGEFVKAAQAKRRDFSVDWVHLKLNDQAQRTVLCKDPFASVDARVDRLIEAM